MNTDASPAEHAEESVRWMSMSQAHPITRNVSGAGSVSMPCPTDAVSFCYGFASDSNRNGEKK